MYTWHPLAAVQAHARLGRAIGLAFQIVDDVLDVTSVLRAIGEDRGKRYCFRKSNVPISFWDWMSRLRRADRWGLPVERPDSLPQAPRRERDGPLLAERKRISEPNRYLDDVQSIHSSGPTCSIPSHIGP